jgi:glutamyl-tRNA reductase
VTSELFAAGLNHKSAPVELRERLAVPDDDHARILAALRAKIGLDEIMLLSTCNRVEVYAVAAAREFDGDAVLGALAELQGVETGLLDGHVFVRAAGDAARHVFRVAASLESLVVGEPQILGQVKEAFARAQESGAVGPVLDRCLSLAFKSAKRVRTETEIAQGGASVPSVAVDLARSIFGELDGCAALVVGAGEMAEQAALHLRAGGLADIVVVNRSEPRGQALADRVGGRFEPWDRLAVQLARADVVVTSTGSRMPVVDRATLRPVMKHRRSRPLFFVDIAVPRDIDPDVVKHAGVFLYNVDDLQGIVHDNMRSRRGEAERASALVDEEVGEFLQWMRSRAVGPLIGRLQARGREIADAEVERTLARLAGLTPEQQAAVQQMAHAIVQKILHKPMVNARKAERAALAEALAILFELGAEPAASVVEARTDGEEPAVAPVRVEGG